MGCDPSVALALASEINPIDTAPLDCFPSALVSESAVTVRRPSQLAAFRERVVERLVALNLIFQPMDAQWGNRRQMMRQIDTSISHLSAAYYDGSCSQIPPSALIYLQE